jgi:hypothetical protein
MSSSGEFCDLRAARAHVQGYALRQHLGLMKSTYTSYRADTCAAIYLVTKASFAMILTS